MASNWLNESSARSAGEVGENRVVSFLQSHGHEILARNYRFSKVAEIDIVSLTPDRILCFVEVKTRKKDQSWSALDSIDEMKQQRLEQCGEWFLQHYEGPCEGCRFDAAFVFSDRDGSLDVEYMENIF